MATSGNIVCGLLVGGLDPVLGDLTQGPPATIPGQFDESPWATTPSAPVRSLAATPAGLDRTAAGAAPSMFSDPPANAVIGVPYQHTFLASLESPTPTYRVTMGTLPPGLVLAPSGVLSGAPTTIGTFGPTTVTASDGIAPPVPQTFSISIGHGVSRLGGATRFATAAAISAATWPVPGSAEVAYAATRQLPRCPRCRCGGGQRTGAGAAGRGRVADRRGDRRRARPAAPEPDDRGRRQRRRQRCRAQRPGAIRDLARGGPGTRARTASLLPRRSAPTRGPSRASPRWRTSPTTTTTQHAWGRPRRPGRSQVRCSYERIFPVDPATAAELNLLQPRVIVPVGRLQCAFHVGDAWAALTPYATTHRVDRYSGPDLFKTAAQISANMFTPGEPAADPADRDNFPDASAGVLAAGTVQGPVLLIGANRPVDPAVVAELTVFGRGTSMSLADPESSLIPCSLP